MVPRASRVRAWSSRLGASHGAPLPRALVSSVVSTAADSEWRGHPRDRGSLVEGLGPALQTPNPGGTVRRGPSKVQGARPRIPPFGPIFPLVLYDGNGYGLTERTADRAVLIEVRRFPTMIHIVTEAICNQEVAGSSPAGSTDVRY